MKQVYESAQHDDYMLEEKNRRRNFQRLIGVIVRYVEANCCVKLLDIGSSIGLFLDTVKRLYPQWSLIGVEASASAVRMCEKLYRIKLESGMFENVNIPRASQDIVTMLDFIEHVRLPLSSIRAANRCLKPGGLLVITTPNIESWTSRLFGRYWWGFRLMHTLYFSPLSMQQMLARGGFRLIKKRGLIRMFSLSYCVRHLGWTFRAPAFRMSFPLALGDMLILARKEVAVQ